MVQNPPAIRQETSLSGRFVGYLRGAVVRLLGVGLPGFSASGGGIPANPTYNVDRTMAALAENPWVYACVQALATDLAALPLVAETGRGDNREQTSDNPLLTLFENPHPKVSGRRLRRQLVADFKLSGNCYIRVWRDGQGRPIQLGRIPPQAIEAIVGADGEPLAWKLQDKTLSWSDVLHIGDINWPATVALVYGQSPIVPLALGLQVDKDSRKQAGRAAKRGRLEMLLSPKDPYQFLLDQSVRGMSDQYARALEEGHGVYIPNAAMEATALSLTARDGEFLGMRDRTRAEILAVFGVPETRVGAPAANYGTSKQQMRTYGETLLGIAALFDDEFSRLAPPGVRIRHNFAQVEALQTSQTERQARAAVWVASFGMSPRDAARYEGFIDAPIPEDAEGNGSTPAETDENGNPPADEPREEALTATGQVLASLVFGAEALRTADPEDGPNGAEIALREVLRMSLIRHGANPKRAREVAEDAAAVCRMVAEKSPGEDLTEVSAFRYGHAQRILRNAGLDI